MDLIIEGNIIDLWKREIYAAKISISNGFISKIERSSEIYSTYICCGLVDSHVHIESSMLTPDEFGRIAIKHGTVAVVSDPHEIANVMGCKGIDFMLNQVQKTPLKCFFTIPSCVPATDFDINGATITSSDIKKLIMTNQFVGLSEFMNISGLLNNDPEVVYKVELAKQYNLPIDGHAPGLQG